MWIPLLVFAAILLLTYMSIRFLIYTAAAKLRENGRMEKPTHSDVAIVLGAYTDGYRPSAPLLGRLKAGLHLYRLGYVSYMIVSGGKGPDETVSESSSMKRFLSLNGVPSFIVLEEWNSSDTWENLSNSKDVMDRFGLKTAVVVTSDYHLPRALAIARQLKMDVSGFACSSSPGEFHSAVREVLAWAKYILKGQAGVRRKGRFNK